MVFGGGLDLAAAGGEESGAGFELVAGMIAAGGETSVDSVEPRGGGGDEFVARGVVGEAGVAEFLMQREERGADGVEGRLAVGRGAVAFGAGLGSGGFTAGTIGERVAEAEDEAEIISGLDAAEAGRPTRFAAGGVAAGEAFLGFAPAGERSVAGLRRRGGEAGEEGLVRCGCGERGEIGERGVEVGWGGAPKGGEGLAGREEKVLGVFAFESGVGEGEARARGFGRKRDVGAGLGGDGVGRGLGELGEFPGGGEFGLSGDDADEAARRFSVEFAAAFLPSEALGLVAGGGDGGAGCTAVGEVERTAELEGGFEATSGAECAGAESVFEL